MECGDDMSPAVGEPAAFFAVEVVSGCSTENEDELDVATANPETKCDVRKGDDQLTGMSDRTPTAKCAAKRKAKRKVSGEKATPKTPKAKARTAKQTHAKEKCAPKAKALAKKKASPKAKALTKQKPKPKTKATNASTKQKDEVERKMHSAPKLF